MNLRREIRKSIQRGTALPATVEDYHLGWATVRLATNGARLTNLSTQGAIVESGDRVIVDYSAGVMPVVRPLFIPQYEEETLEPSRGFETDGMDDDWSCLVTCDPQNGFGVDPDGNIPPPGVDSWQNFVPMETWTRVRWIDNWWYASWGPGGIYGSSCEAWDTGEGTAGMYNETYNYGQDYVTITRTGRYYIQAQIEFDDCDGNRTTGIAELYWDHMTWYVMDYNVNPYTGEPRTEYNLNGHFAMRITKNDVPVAMVNGRSTECGSWTQGGLDGPYMAIQAIVWCEVGDIMAVEIWENNNGPYMNPGWGFPMSGTEFGNRFALNLIPGTERAVYQSTSSQHAYMYARNDRVHAYTIGAYEGGWDFSQSAYLVGSWEAGKDFGYDYPMYPTPDAHKHAYIYGDDGTYPASDNQHAYILGSPHI